MDILIIGSGAREYSIGLSLLNDKRISNIYFCPGNGASLLIGKNIDIKGNKNIVAFCIDKQISLVIIGPEQPLVEGLSDDLMKANIRVFAPSKGASILESSKIFMKNFLHRYNIPTANSIQGNNKDILLDFIDSITTQNIVLKADGLCGGKGVVILNNKLEAKETLENMLSGKLFGEAGKSVVIEEYLDGFELSVFAICDGEDFILLPVAQDHKRLLDNDLGPNTGGMGAYSPTTLCNDELLTKIKDTIISPTLKAMRNEGREFKGVLFCGIMVVDNKPFVLEFNVRFGDPECEVILPLLKTPLLDILNAAIDGNLKDFKYEVLDKYCVGVVVASKDYPYSSKANEKVVFNDINYTSNQASHISFAGVSNINSNIYASGGRVFVSIGIGDNIKEAKDNAYNLCKNISFNGAQKRNDIAFRALNI
ncbi:phosphoribosylamine--glycine ligase [Helicobacter sp. MIT 14-3879]|uniref:phosphoribosylamine--glycine ligase n=1 Tax=Helicobacter sp. MIT 14-3879 TaxID=2040649 RepID=UPI000E1F9665|nr:phosphoribosylamine--glycine ligase [Helicobacter sp. MIT 14-3879]RDU64142.1 phosphoribosylamine--glycine ligase [Helicobacter sp. MIT 14-3879]